MSRIDLNCDYGEDFGAYKLSVNKEILKYVSSVNIACGFHAGDPSTMNKAVKLAIDNHVAIGAHPGLPDLQGFGRRYMSISPEEVFNITLYQIGALSAFVKAEGGVLRHVKPHGALYHMAAKDFKIAQKIAEAIYQIDPRLILVGLANSELIKAGKEKGLQVANEAFVDRTYEDDGSLTARSIPGAVIDCEKKAIKQAIQLAKTGEVKTNSGKVITTEANTLCLHGDNEQALAFAKALNEELSNHKIHIKPL
jgi:5-oxoprolinase (ATP-hydrolysing) subunit A